MSLYPDLENQSDVQGTERAQPLTRMVTLRSRTLQNQTAWRALGWQRAGLVN